MRYPPMIACKSYRECMFFVNYTTKKMPGTYQYTFHGKHESQGLSKIKKELKSQKKSTKRLRVLKVEHYRVDYT